MTQFVTDKFKITELVINELNSDFPPEDLERAVSRWWRNPRRDGGLRLTDLGAMKFDAATIEYSEFPYIGNLYTSRYLLKLDRLLVSPYYLIYKGQNLTVRIYDDRIVTMIILYGSLEGYINSLEENNSD
jgi:hypothetical protein